MVDTFEKMDPINPTFDWRAERSIINNEDKIDVFSNFNHLFGVGPFV